ncbi:MAG TPA: hypothetical protein VHM91_21770 [Verrucomicrobiales bacterium]|jgi:hypothetical protein|nr:hypothetical protein [Verrucomicrobiales bacterium]
MASRRQTPDPLAETPFWRTRGFVLGMVALTALATAGLTMWLVGLNHRQQMQWRMEEDPALLRIKQNLVKQIAAAKPGQLQAPRILWLGRIREFTESQSTDGSPPVSVLKLGDASLIAGARSKKDSSDTPVISGKQYAFSGPPPRPGEVWLIAASMNKEDNYVLHTAVRTSLK